MLADKLEEWAKAFIAEGKQEGILEGKQEGRQEGEVLALQKLLAKRFGVIPLDITAQISVASAQEIDSWLIRVLDAETLADVFKI